MHKNRVKPLLPKVSRQTGALQVSSSRGRQSTSAAESESLELLVLLGDRCSSLALASCSLQGKHLPCLLPGSTEAFSSREGPRSQICPSLLGFAFVWNCLTFIGLVLGIQFSKASYSQDLGFPMKRRCSCHSNTYGNLHGAKGSFQAKEKRKEGEGGI